MLYKDIKFEKEDGFCVITLNRPEVLNAVGIQMDKDLINAIDEIKKDEEIVTFIITGAPRPDGRSCFCSGGNFREIDAAQFPRQSFATEVQSMWTDERTLELGCWEKLSICPKVAIAAVDGVCVSGGLELALVCDIILVSETAQIGDLHTKGGRIGAGGRTKVGGGIGGAGVNPLLARRVGVGKAIELSCTGDVIDGKEAYRIGLANQVFVSDKLIDGAKELAKKIAARRLAATQMVKASCRAIYDMDYRTAWRYADVCGAALQAEPDGDR